MLAGGPGALGPRNGCGLQPGWLLAVVEQLGRAAPDLGYAERTLSKDLVRQGEPPDLLGEIQP